MSEKLKDLNILTVINVVAGLILTGLAIYFPAGTAVKFLGFADPFAPVVYLVVLFLFADNAVKKLSYTLVNLGCFALAGVLLLVPMPEAMMGVIRWWYPLTFGLVLGVFVDLQ